MSTRLIARLPIAGILVALFACAGERAAEEGAMESAAMPDTTVDAVWAHVEEANYQENWQLWPGLGKFRFFQNLNHPKMRVSKHKTYA